MKARNIIKGWPRPRSTVSWKPKPYEWINDSLFWWLYRDIKSSEMQESLKLDNLYHQMQQAMVNEYFASYRLTRKTQHYCVQYFSTKDLGEIFKHDLK